MLKSLQISNYALIDKLEIAFDKGLTIITGETGAGKSIIIGALSLLMGQRADINTIRNKEKKCSIEGIFDVSKYNLQDFFKQYDIDYFDQTILRREISAEGRSRAFINDSPVNLNTLKKLSDFLIDIHSQHDTLLINRPNYQIDALDSFSKNMNLLKEYKKNYEQYKKHLRILDELTEKAEKEKQKFEYFQFQFNQLEEAKLVDGEEEELEEEQKQLSHIEEIKQNLSKLTFLLDNDENSVLSMLKESSNIMQNISQFFPKASEFFERIENARFDLQDIANESQILENNLDFDPNRFDFVNSRLNTIYELERKFNLNSVKQLIELKDEFASKIQEIESFDQEIEKLKQIIEQLKQKLNKLSSDIHKKRTEAKPVFEQKIIEIVKELGIKNAVFVVEITKTEDFMPNGKDKVNFLFSANKNTEPSLISKIASGGELSRLMLALKYIISQSKTLPTIIFDEIDTGISGEIADKMGKMLRQMAKNIQLINITHLPQVAAKGDHHFFVYKQDTEADTITNIKKLNKTERIQEIAKMLSGSNVSKTSLKAAEELLNS